MGHSVNHYAVIELATGRIVSVARCVDWSAPDPPDEHHEVIAVTPEVYSEHERWLDSRLPEEALVVNVDSLNNVATRNDIDYDFLPDVPGAIDRTEVSLRDGGAVRVTGLQPSTVVKIPRIGAFTVHDSVFEVVFDYPGVYPVYLELPGYAPVVFPVKVMP